MAFIKECAVVMLVALCIAVVSVESHRKSMTSSLKRYIKLAADPNFGAFCLYGDKILQHGETIHEGGSMCYCTEDSVVICSRATRAARLYRRKQQSVSTWTQSKYVGAVGSNLTLSCIVTQVGLFDVVRISRRDIDTGDVVAVADRSLLKSPFSESGRYTVKYTNEDGVAVMILSITDAQDTDSGDYTCGVRDDKAITIDAEVEVKVGCFDRHVLYVGDNINDCELITDTATECQIACQKSADCTHFQMISGKFRDTKRHGQCCFKKGLIEKVVEENYHGLISGPATCPDVVVA